MLAGAVGFLVGFYGGFFLILSIWGLEADELAFVFIAGGLGVIASGAAIAFTLRSTRRWAAFFTNALLGVALLVIVLVFDADAAAMAVGGLILVLATSVLARTGKLDTVAG